MVMARNESDREDLFEEALALSPCWEFLKDGCESPIVTGFRKSGFLSIYFGPDPVYHFDNELRIRRSYSGGFLFRTEGTTLSRIHRVRSESQTQLRRHDLTPVELDQFGKEMYQHLQKFFDQLPEMNTVGMNRLEILRQRGVTSDDLDRLRSALHQILARPIQLAPPIR